MNNLTNKYENMTLEEVLALGQENVMVALQKIKGSLERCVDTQAKQEFEITKLTQTQNEHSEIINRLKEETNVLGAPIHGKRKKKFGKRASRRVIDVLGGDISSSEYLLFSSFLYKKIYRDLEETFDVGSWTDISMDNFDQSDSLYERAKNYVDMWHPSKQYVLYCLKQLEDKRDNGILSAERCRALTDFLKRTNNGNNIWFCM